MSDPGVRRRGLSWGRITVIVAAVVMLVAVAFGVRALSAPVERAGEPTIPVPAPSGTRFLSPSPSPSGSATTSPSGTASTSSATPARTPSIKATADFDWADVTAAAAGSSGTLYRYSVAVESSAKLKPNSVAGSVADVLNDPRSWTGTGEVRFALVAESKATVKVYLASTKTASALCDGDGEAAYTCVQGDTVVINAGQWRSAPASYAGDLGDYRTFLINHAFGHLIGEKHAECAGKGKQAPVMLQQGAGLFGCTANPWP